MADLFTVTAPMTIRLPSGETHIMAAVFKHPDGLLYFDLYWDMIEENKGLDDAAHIVKGEIKGEGPWKIGDCIVYLLGCQGTDPKLAIQFSQWQLHFEQRGYNASSKELLRDKARRLGANVD